MHETITQPLDASNLVQIPYDKDVYICPSTLLRFRAKGDRWERDHYGEAEWSKMANYVGQSYEDVARAELDYAKQER